MRSRAPSILGMSGAVFEGRGVGIASPATESGDWAIGERCCSLKEVTEGGMAGMAGVLENSTL